MLTTTAMNSTELRSGNLILWNGSPYRVTALDISKLETYPGENVKAEGIALTEAWLVRAEFEPCDEPYTYKKNMGALTIKIRCYAGKSYMEFGPVYVGSIKTVNRLQNIWHSMSDGQELTIKQD